MKCFIAIEEDLLLKLWMLDPQLVAPFSQTHAFKKATESSGVQQANKRSKSQLKACCLTIEADLQTSRSLEESMHD